MYQQGSRRQRAVSTLLCLAGDGGWDELRVQQKTGLRSWVSPCTPRGGLRWLILKVQHFLIGHHWMQHPNKKATQHNFRQATPITRRQLGGIRLSEVKVESDPHGISVSFVMWVIPRLVSLARAARAHGTLSHSRNGSSGTTATTAADCGRGCCLPHSTHPLQGCMLWWMVCLGSGVGAARLPPNTQLQQRPPPSIAAAAPKRSRF